MNWYTLRVISGKEKKIKESTGRMIIKLEPLSQLEKSNYDITLEDGDVLIIPEHPETIQVVGGVQQPMALLYQKGNKPRHYIRQAGSYTEFARKNKHFLLKANGTVKINGTNVSAGDTIYVPEKVKVYTNWLEVATKITTLVVQTLTSLVITGIIDP